MQPGHGGADRLTHVPCRAIIRAPGVQPARAPTGRGAAWLFVRAWVYGVVGSRPGTAQDLPLGVQCGTRSGRSCLVGDLLPQNPEDGT